MTTPLKPRYFLFAMLLSTTVAAVDSAMPAGSGSPAAAGNGPGMGHDYRRNVGGPGINKRPATGPQAEASAVPPPPAAYPYPQRHHYLHPPYPAPFGYMTPQHRQGYGYPGYRGHGGTGYPRHYQYGSPPGYPPTPVTDQ